jgi:hypothetical protein
MPVVLGLDLGQANDRSALAVAEVDALADPRPVAVVGLKRWDTGTSYVTVADEVEALLVRKVQEGEAGQRDGWHGPTLVIDASGVGRPVVDVFRDRELPAEVRAVVITAGLAESFVDGYYHVAKAVLISRVQVLLQRRALRFAAGLPLTPVLVREFENYRVKVTPAANETFSAREGEHDDLLLAVALCCWQSARWERPAEAFKPVTLGRAGAARKGPQLFGIPVRGRR